VHQLIKRLIHRYRTINCFNFDCKFELNGVCRKRQIHLGGYDAKKPNVLICTSFRQAIEEVDNS